MVYPPPPPPPPPFSSAAPPPPLAAACLAFSFNSLLLPSSIFSLFVSRSNIYKQMSMCHIKDKHFTARGKFAKQTSFRESQILQEFPST